MGVISERRAPARTALGIEVPWARVAPALLAGVLATAYVAVSPQSLDLAAHMFRAQLFASEGFGIWNNWWYGGHPVVMYSVLFPAVAAALTPQLAAALAVVGAAALFEPLAHRHFGRSTWLGALWFAAGAATNLYTGRLTFAFGLLPAVATMLALQHRRRHVAPALAALTALCSPVAALFVALGAAAVAVGSKERAAGVAVALAALAPVALLAVAFPEGGVEPFVFSAFWTLPLIAAGLAVLTFRREPVLFAGVVLYAIATILCYLIPSAVGSNVGRLGELAAGPLAALLLWPARRVLLLIVAIPLLYLQWHAPVRDVSNAGGEAMTRAYYQPLLSFLTRQGGPPFRIEIPFTKFHWEAYAVAPHFPLARGWERQLDIEYNPLFYGGALTAVRYDRWLHDRAVRFVAVADAPLDYSAVAERRLIDRGLPYLRAVWHSRHWRVYAVADPTPIAQGAAVLTHLGPNWFSLRATRAGNTLVRIQWSPYWKLTSGHGCVAPAGSLTRLVLSHPGPATVAIRFSLARIGTRSARCS